MLKNTIDGVQAKNLFLRVAEGFGFPAGRHGPSYIRPPTLRGENPSGHSDGPHVVY